MAKRVTELIDENKIVFFRFLNKFAAKGNRLAVKGNLLEALEQYKAVTKKNNLDEIKKVIERTTEAICMGSSFYMEVREKIGLSDFYRFHLEDKIYESITVDEYLMVKERYIDPHTEENDQLTINFKSFYDKFPSVNTSKSIGKGVEYLNRHLSSQMFTNPEKLRNVLFDFLFLHKHEEQQLILNDRIRNHEHLSGRIDKALKILVKKDEDEPYEKFKHSLQELGFEPGLGNTAGRILESLEMLERLIQSPDHIALKEFLSRIPMIFNIAIISPHGYFGQEGVLGLPDTGGQVVYILDQVKALEKAMTHSLQESGLEAKPKIIILSRLIPNASGTACNQHLEKVYDTSNCWILRIPFRAFNKEITDNWISRFEIWPYLETFAEDSSKELLAQFGRRPDFIIGNYSDGNMVAFMLARKFGVTMAIIAHALEKSKYLYSGLYWKELESSYHFSVQFTADLLAMNAANFIITSSYQEIAGTNESIGQYESYKQFTMPGLYRVVGGINLFHPKFNILPPGVNKNIYFPYTNDEERLHEVKDELEKLLFGKEEDEDVIGKLENPELTPLFSLARLDKIKNLTSLAEWYGKSKELQKRTNLIIVAGKISAEQASDREEKEQINLMHQIIKKYNLYNKVRWIGKLFRKDQTGEVYRLIADRQGIFVQPALFEGFGLTVLEAMRSGVPVFATQYGGPLEIIQDGVSGFHIDPINGKETTKKIVDFLNQCSKDKSFWNRISKKGIERVDTAFNWDLYASNLLSLSKIYGFWRFTTNIEMEEMKAYLDVIYNLLYKPRAKKIMKEHLNRE